MSLRKAGRMSMKSKAVVLATLILGVTAATALAANVSGDGTLVGSTGPDNIAAGGASNDIVWGLGTTTGTTDTISAGGGAYDMVDGGGHCTGVGPGDYPGGLPNSGSCEHGPTPPNCGTENISVGGGHSDMVFGNCGPNTISVGSGSNDTVTAYGGPNNISVGGSGNGDVIDLSHETAGPNNISTGKGSEVVYAQNGQVDNLTCGSKLTVVYVDSKDKTKNCTVRTSPQPARDVMTAVRHTTTHKKLRRASHGR
jgi:hypothetical protein